MANILFLDMFANAGLARLPQLFKNEGNQCSAIAFEDKLLLKTSALQHRFAFPEGARVGSMKKMMSPLSVALKVCQPSFLITSDEVLIRNLLKIRQNLRDNSNDVTPLQESLLNLLENSLPSDALVYTRPKNMEVIKAAGFQTPEYFSATSWEQLSENAPNFGFPFYLKQSYEAGGTGVTKIFNAPMLDQTILAYKDSKVQIDESNPILGQRELAGNEITVNFSAWKGMLLGFDVIQTLERQRLNGPSSVVRKIFRPQWETPLKRLISTLNYSGFGGLDVFENGSSSLPVVIEANFRPTHSLQVSPQLSSSLIQRFSASLNNTKILTPEQPQLKEEKTAVIFPDEILRDKYSPYLSTCPANIPWEDPQLLEFYLPRIGVLPKGYESTR